MTAVIRQIRGDAKLHLLACGAIVLGATAAFTALTLLDGALSGQISATDSNRLCWLWEDPQGAASFAATEAALVEWRGRLRSIMDIQGYLLEPSPTVVELPQGPRFVQRGRMEAGLPEFLGVPPVLGRTLSADVSASAEVLVAEAFWRTALSSDPNVIGRPLRTDGYGTLTIVGVLPSRFPVLPGVELWSAWRPSAIASLHPQLNVAVIGRLAARFSLGDAQRELVGLPPSPPRQQWRRGAAPFRDGLLGSHKTALQYAATGGLLLLAIAAFGAAQLMSASSYAHRGAYQIRLAIGAPRGRLLAVEAARVAVIGAVSLLVALWVSSMLVGRYAGMAIPSAIVRAQRAPALNNAWAALAICVGLVAIHCLSVAPLLKWRGASGLHAMRGTTTTLSTAFLLFELVVTAALSCATAVLGVGLYAQLTRRVGVRTDGVFVATVQMPIIREDEEWVHYPTPRFAQDSAAFISRMRAAVPEVRVALTSDVPLTRETRPNSAFVVPPRSTFAAAEPTTRFPRNDASLHRTYVHRVSDGFFEVLDIPLQAGRTFTANDAMDTKLLDDWATPRGEGVAILNSFAARAIFGSGAQAIGKLIGLEADFVPARRIVGVVADTRLNQLDSGEVAHVYVPFAQSPLESFSVVTCCGAFAHVRDAVNPGPGARLAVRDATSLSALLAKPFSVERAAALIIAAFAGCALIVCACAMYGTTAAYVRRRERELGLRVALGASPRDLQLRLYRSVLLKALGCAAGGAALTVAGLPLLDTTSGHRALVVGAIIGPSVMCAVVTMAVVPVCRRIATIDPAALLTEIP